VHDAIQVDNAVTGFGDFCGGRGEHVSRVAAAVGFLCVGEHATNIGQGGGAKDGIRDRVQQDVGIAVADELPVVRYVDPAEAQRAAGRGSVRVFADADTKVGRGWSPWGLPLRGL
jgi:hypothetical protein